MRYYNKKHWERYNSFVFEKRDVNFISNDNMTVEFSIFELGYEERIEYIKDTGLFSRSSLS